MFSVTKTYGHERGLSCAFRQWRAKSHCAQIHGYALAFEFEFRAAELNAQNWVIDFGGLKILEAKLKEYFDHTLAVATDDPEREQLVLMNRSRLASIRFMDAVGCEAFAKFAAECALDVVDFDGGRVFLYRVTVSEHGANSASYFLPVPFFGTQVTYGFDPAADMEARIAETIATALQPRDC